MVCSVGPLRVGMLPLVPEVTQRLLQEQLNPGVPVAIPAWKVGIAARTAEHSRTSMLELQVCLHRSFCMSHRHLPTQHSTRNVCSLWQLHGVHAEPCTNQYTVHTLVTLFAAPVQDMSRTEQFMRGFLTLKNAFGPKHAFAYWASVKDPAVTSDQLLSLFEKAWTAAAKAGKSSWTTPKRAERAAQKKPAEVGNFQQ